ncbi:MAG: hypothetical protein KJT01_12755, partial [Gemmatimonadetes bacterium]|nr:hypothetical protein [Gemmatimonadota bacterium]
EARLVAEVREADGQPAALLPYMGMDGHALVVRADGGVFMHLHPAGMASMAAQAQLQEPGPTTAGAAASPADGAPAAGHAGHAGMTMGAVRGAPGTVAFPVAFPSAGVYRVFVQLRRGGAGRGAVETAAFDVTVDG